MRTSVYTHDERDKLITKVWRGELTREEAEAEAERRGLKPLRRNPDPEDFNPMNEPHWTLPMAVAWITYRTPEAVREWWDAYRSKCEDWEFKKDWSGPDGVPYTGWFLERRREGNLNRLGDAGAIGPPVGGDALEMSVPEAIQALKDALGISILPATGVNKETDKRETIPAESWQDLEFRVERGRDYVRTVNEEGRGFVRYDHVTVPRDAMWQLWAPRSAQGKVELPPLITPEGAGYMPLYCAAQWIATEGGSIGFDPEDTGRWQPAYATLLDHIASEDVTVTGEPGDRGGVREPVPGAVFAGCEVDYPYQDITLDLMMSERFFVRSYPYIDDEHWRGGFDDSFENRWERGWRRLMVRKSDIARIWPFDVGAAMSLGPTQYRTGAPGRPSSMFLVEAEFARRCDGGEVAETVTRESEQLASWFKESHLAAPPLTAKTIRTKIAARFRSYQRARN